MLASAARALSCRHCGAEQPLSASYACPDCFGPLEIAYDPAALARVSAATIGAGPTNMWRYSALLPAGTDPASRVSLDPGWTPLVRADRLAAELGMRAPLWVKDDSGNPTHSFKDRVVSVAATAARQLGFDRIACASTGNLAHSVAAHAARAGLPAIIFVPADLELGKIISTTIHGVEVVAVDGSYDDVNRLCGLLCDTDEFATTAFVNVNLRPFYAEGSKTLGYEVAEQLGWRIPEQVILPMASGELLTKVDRAFTELVELGLAQAPADGWRVFGAQSAGCAPIVAALLGGGPSSGTNSSDGTVPGEQTRITPVKPTGIAKSLNIGDPAAGPYALAAVNRTGGWMAAVDDDQIRAAIGTLARTTGIFTETAGGVTVAATRDLLGSGKLDQNRETVMYITGDGLKTMDALTHSIRPTYRIEPSLRSARQAHLIG